MWGAVIGDLAGSIYEFDQVKNAKQVEVKELMPGDSFFSDDTILTVAVLDAINNDRDYEKYLKAYATKFIEYKPNFSPYFKSPFSPGFTKWVRGEGEGKSTGNGAMMRVSPVGFMFDSEEEVRENARLATIPSHNSEEAIKAAELVALTIFYARNGYGKKDILEKLNIDLKYVPFEKFNATCETTVDNCMYALFTSESFAESVSKVISYGGDTDTNACIVGSMAEAMYGVPKVLVRNAKEKLPREFVKVLEKGYKNKKQERETIDR
jgi:ADP-ribosylglycohydrolase